MIVVDRDICTGCLTCMKVCPFTVLEESPEGGPRMAEGKSCMACMHCGVVCPTGAITYDGKKAVLSDELPTLSDNFTADLKNHILMRRSYRHFSRERVPREIIEDALELAEWTPSAKNQHPAKWMIVESREVLDKIMELILEYVERTGVSPEIGREMKAGNNVVMGTAQTILLAYADNDTISPDIDTSIALTTAELYLQAQGIGTCWAGYMRRMANSIPEIRELLPEIPENSSFYGALMIGYPEGEKYTRIPQRFDKADIKWV